MFLLEYHLDDSRCCSKTCFHRCYGSHTDMQVVRAMSIDAPSYHHRCWSLNFVQLTSQKATPAFYPEGIASMISKNKDKNLKFWLVRPQNSLALWTLSSGFFTEVSISMFSHRTLRHRRWHLLACEYSFSWLFKMKGASLTPVWHHFCEHRKRRVCACTHMLMAAETVCKVLALIQS